MNIQSLSKEKKHIMKKYSYMIAGFDFIVAFVNIYLGFARNNPMSFLAAVICLMFGISAMMD